MLLLHRRVVGSDAKGSDPTSLWRGWARLGCDARRGQIRRPNGCTPQDRCVCPKTTEQVLWVRPQRDYQERGICRKVAARSWALALSRGPSQAWGNRKNPHPQPRVRNWGGHRAREAPRMCCQTSQKNRGSRTPPDSSAHDLGAGVPVGLSRAPWIEFSIGLGGLEPFWV